MGATYRTMTDGGDDCRKHTSSGAPYSAGVRESQLIARQKQQPIKPQMICRNEKVLFLTEPSVP